MQINKKRNINIVILGLLILICVSIAVYKRSTDAGVIFNNSVNSIVELKSCSEDYGENYGTAVFIDNDGLLVTNAHVVTYEKKGEVCQYEQCYIRFATENDYREVNIVKYDVDLDIAILKLNDKNVTYKGIKIGNSDDIDYGDRIYSIGNALNYGISIEEGIISVPRINIEYDGLLRTVIQSDLNISYGNSGGALLDKYGRLIGITSFRTKDDNGDIVYGMAYSIPVNQIMEYLG